VRLGLGTAVNRGFIWGVPASASAAAALLASGEPLVRLTGEEFGRTLSQATSPEELAALALATADKLLTSVSPEERARITANADRKLGGEPTQGETDPATRAVALSLLRRVEAASSAELLGARLEDVAADFKR
jgi:hypothetical protein